MSADERRESEEEKAGPSRRYECLTEEILKARHGDVLPTNMPFLQRIHVPQMLQDGTDRFKTHKLLEFRINENRQHMLQRF
ncbi:hypothetical protein BaRGS_00018148, partial [Batillaria attramentaria]